MRRDLFYFYPADIDTVYVAYRDAIKNRLGKEAECRPVHMLVFSLNFSFKFNMNGGGCHVHFMRYNGGTAINIRYTIAQATGARYEAHANELNLAVDKLLGMKAQRINLNAELFEANKEERPIMTNRPPVSSPMFFNAPVPAPAPAPAPTEPPTFSERARFCGNCGTQFLENSNFCSNCGAKRG